MSRRRMAPDRQILALFRKFGVTGDVATWIDGGSRHFSVSRGDYTKLTNRTTGPQLGVVELGHQLLALVPERGVSVGFSGPLSGALDIRTLGCPICDRHEPGAGMHVNCIMR